MNTHDKTELPPLPSWNDAKLVCQAGEDGPIERFVYENEPEDSTAAVNRWRDGVQAILNIAIEPYIKRIAELEAAIEADRKRRGEPVAKVNDEGFIVETGLGLVSGTKLYASPQPAEPRDPAKDAVEEDNRRAAEQACNVLALRLGYVWNGEDWVEHKPAEPVKVPSVEAMDVINLALEYWADRQQRYKNRAPVWVTEARALLARYGQHAHPSSLEKLIK